MFSPTGRSFSAVTTEGLLIYSLDETLIFNPFELGIDITPQNVEKCLSKFEYLKALVVLIDFILTKDQMSFHLNEKALITKVFESIPPLEIQLIVQDLPYNYLNKYLSSPPLHDWNTDCWLLLQNIWKNLHIWNLTYCGVCISLMNMDII